jgi:hypothetical protein
VSSCAGYDVRFSVAALYPISLTPRFGLFSAKGALFILAWGNAPGTRVISSPQR